MRLSSTYRLLRDNGSAVPFVASPHTSGVFAANRPNYLILHYTAGGTMSGAVNWFKNPQAQASAHLVIDHDGAITQMVPLNKIAWHAGRSSWNGIVGLNSHSIGIEIVNWGLLNGARGNWRAYTGQRLSDDRVIEARHKSYDSSVLHGWEIFDEAQMEAVFDAARAIVTHFNIPEANVLGHDDIAPGRKQDPGPAFNLDRFKSKLYGRADDADDLFRVESPTGLNLRSGPGTGHARLMTLADGTRLRRIGIDGEWMQVAVLNASGQEEASGWAHTRWLREVA